MPRNMALERPKAVDVHKLFPASPFFQFLPLPSEVWVKDFKRNENLFVSGQQL